MRVIRKVVYFGLSYCARIEQSRYHQLNDDIQKDNSFIYTHMFDFTFQIGLMTKKNERHYLFNQNNCLTNNCYQAKKNNN